jgi:hypothetical protein
MILAGLQAQGSITREATSHAMGIMLFIVLPMLATIPVTALICRARIARKKPMSYGTMFTAACSIPLLVAVIATCLQPDIRWSRGHKLTPQIVVATLGFMAAMCVLPALGVVVYFQKRKKRH